MFDWIVFDPSRLTQPVTLTGIIFAVVGLIVVLLAGIVSDAVNARREKKDKAAVNSLAFVIRTVGTALVIIGALMAIITA